VEKIEYFDYRRVAREMKVPAVILKKIEKEVKDEFPKDNDDVRTSCFKGSKKQVLAKSC
jgi:hypothetical protein